MPEFLTTRGMGHRLEAIIADATAQITLISPYWQVPTTFLARLKVAEQRGVQINLVYGKSELKEVEREKLRGLKRLGLFYLEHLHAKCYANEHAVIIGSMNLYDFSERTNVEMGVLLTPEDGEAFRKAQEEVRCVLETSVREQPTSGLRAVLTSLLSQSKPAPQKPAPQKAARLGYCLRCRTAVAYQPQAPLCDPCFKSWAAWGNEDYPERNCHRCGKAADVSKAKPLCYGCFRAEPFTPTTFS